MFLSFLSLFWKRTNERHLSVCFKRWNKNKNIKNIKGLQMWHYHLQCLGTRNYLRCWIRYQIRVNEIKVFSWMQWKINCVTSRSMEKKAKSLYFIIHFGDLGWCCMFQIWMKDKRRVHSHIITKIISYWISYQLNQVCDIKIDTLENHPVTSW